MQEKIAHNKLDKLIASRCLVFSDFFFVVSFREVTFFGELIELSGCRERILSQESIVNIAFFTIHVSVRLSDRSEVTQHKINFVKKCSQWGLNSQPPDHQSHALPLC